MKQLDNKQTEDEYIQHLNRQNLELRNQIDIMKKVISKY
jgi:hypothetical protein